MRILLARRPVAGQRSAENPVAVVLEERGHQVLERRDGPLSELSGELRPDLVWIHGNAAWFPRLRRDLMQLPLSTRPLVAIWHFEPLPPPRSSGLPRPRRSLRELAKVLLRDPRATDTRTNLRVLTELQEAGLPDVLAVTTASRKELLAEIGIDSVWAPFGGHELVGRDLGLLRDVDVLFLGTLDVRRRRAALRHLRRAEITPTVQSSWSDPAGYGESRLRLLNRTRILLNILRHSGEFSGLRFVLGAANGVLVVSESVYRPDPFVPGVHFVEAPLEEVPAVVRHYLAHEDERLAIATAARRLVEGELRLDRSVDLVLDRATRLLARRG